METAVNLWDLKIPWAESDDVFTVLEKAANDHSELFYVNPAAYMRGTGDSTGTYVDCLELEYLDFSPAGSTLEEAISDFNAAITEARAQIAGVTDDVEKALVLHDWLVIRCAYNPTVANEGKSFLLTLTMMLSMMSSPAAWTRSLRQSSQRRIRKLPSVS